MACVKRLIKFLLNLLVFSAFLYLLYILVQSIANELDFFFRECRINARFDFCNYFSLLLVDLDFLKNALIGLAGNIITIFTVSGLSAIILYAHNTCKFRTIRNVFRLTKTNTVITILVSKVYISEQKTGRRWKNEEDYPGYQGFSFVENEYKAALSIKDIFKKKKLLFSLQDLVGFINSDFLKISSINVEIIPCPDDASELESLICDAVVRCNRSLIVLGSPVNNQLTEFIYFGTIKNARISHELNQLRNQLLKKAFYTINRAKRVSRTWPIHFSEEKYGVDEIPCVRIKHKNYRTEYKGLIKRIPIEQRGGLKSTIILLAGWDDRETKNVVKHFIDNLATMNERKYLVRTLVFRGDNGVHVAL